MCTVKPYHIFNRKIWAFGRFAIRLPSLPWGMDLGSGINFDIFTHVFHGSLFINIYKKKLIHDDDLEDGYNVVISAKRKMTETYIL